MDRIWRGSGIYIYIVRVKSPDERCYGFQQTDVNLET